MALMARYADNHFDLAIVDPPYGIGVSKNGYSTLGDGEKGQAKRKNYGVKHWDSNTPNELYFKELLRISKNQIIWGGNYFIDYLYNTSCMIVWNKNNGSFSMADCEIAWSSFKTAVRMFTYTWNGMLQGDMKNKQIRIHPTEKPIQLYKWLLHKYAKPGHKIIDTHLGSGSIAIACYDYGFDLTACEIDKEYYEAALKRFNIHKSQMKIFS